MACWRRGEYLAVLSVVPVSLSECQGSLNEKKTGVGNCCPEGQTAVERPRKRPAERKSSSSKKVRVKRHCRNGKKIPTKTRGGEKKKRGDLADKERLRQCTQITQRRTKLRQSGGVSDRDPDRRGEADKRGKQPLNKVPVIRDRERIT